MPQGSVGGCYFIPLSFWCRTRTSPTSARIISLTPPGQSTCKVITTIVDDIIDGIVNGIKTIDSTGNPVVVFLDLVCLIADYPAVSPAIDTRGHMANAPCTVCSFHRQRGCYDSDHGYTSFANWQNPSFSRSVERTTILRSSSPSEQQLLSLGMKSDTYSDWRKYPLFLFRTKLLQKRSIVEQTVDVNNIPINHAVFDPYMASIEAPDHCLMGLIKNCIEAYFHSLSNDKIRKQVDLLIVSSLMDNGLPRHSSIYGIKKKKIHSMSMSSVFSVFLILEAIAPYYIERTEQSRKLLQIISTLQVLIKNLYWWPSPTVDGPSAAIYYGNQGQSRLNAESEKTVRFLLKSVNELSISDKTLGSFMDKPNLHRLLELCHHSVFAFGHTRNVAEMGLETVHQILKRSLHGNTHTDKHLTAIHHAICADWQRRVIEGFNEISLETDNLKKLNLLKIQAILMLGKQAERLDITSTVHQEFLASFDEKLSELLKEPFRSYLLNEVSFNFHKESESRVWLGMDIIKDDASTDKSYISQGKEILTSTYGFLECEMICFKAAALTRSSGSKKGRVYPYHKVSYANTIQICTTINHLRGPIVSSEDHGGTNNDHYYNTNIHSPNRRVIAFFAVKCFIKSREGPQLFAIANKLKKLPGTRCFILSSDTIQLVQMSHTVRRVGMIHLCDSCQVLPLKRQVIHSKTIFDRGEYILLPRSSVFPPRMA